MKEYTLGVTGDEQEVSDQVLAERLAKTIPRVEAGAEAQREQLRIIREMKRRKWSQDRIAKILGVSQQAISKRLTKNPEDDITE